MANPTAAMLVIGDEVLSGRTREANAHHLSVKLTEMGVDLREIRVIGDDAPTIARHVNALRAEVDHLFTSGGIGPTHDDMTADGVAQAFGARLAVREDARAILEAYYADPGALNAARLRMARIPDGAALILNPLSQAPGFTLGNVHVMAGVPAIFAAMLEGLLPTIDGGAPVLAWSFRAAMPEGELAGPLTALAAAHPDVGFGSYPFHRGGLGSTLVARSSDRVALERAAEALRAMLASLGCTGAAETPPA
ncbi:competence/damage-inducible protein A [Rubrimonas cliftonensis]|uniref:Molybdenum cofactor synthesis domain-containing protein n=1 Tax=Rubrimonas cliftonensis TaxID=89524 RepID=A0A1H3YJL1_9RHOB|nr:molybdopterin-binding protein [Rubrimonas cliftonensis]SEA11108.1 molybdenum cofactor synthesis domain-containing protein [Rubrimonas cliftonensis]